MEYRDGELKRLHEAEAEILSEVIRICNENDLTYFAYAGTALGAVRHSGFIPWDDDIDIGMLREDYDKFLEIAPKKLKKGYTLQHFTVDENAPAYFAKVRADGTRFVEKNMRHLPIHHGIFVDIFPFDNVPENRHRRMKHHVRANFWRQLYLSKLLWTTKVEISNKFINITAKASRFILHILLAPVPRSLLYRKLDRTIRKYNDLDLQTVSPNEVKMLDWKKCDLVPPASAGFETIQIAIPVNVNKMLKDMYGDYMTLPPKEKRITHVPVELKFL